MRSLRDIGNPYQHTLEVSIVSSPHAGRLEGASDRPEFEAIRPKTAPVASHCKSATCRSVTWKDTCKGHPPSYALAPDGLTVRDNNTGLTWQRSPDTDGDGVARLAATS